MPSTLSPPRSLRDLEERGLAATGRPVTRLAAALCTAWAARVGGRRAGSDQVEGTRARFSRPASRTIPRAGGTLGRCQVSGVESACRGGLQLEEPLLDWRGHPRDKTQKLRGQPHAEP